MIDCEKLSCKSLCNIFFCINKFLQVATLVGVVDVSPHGCFSTWVLPCKNIYGVLIFDLVV
jgi:hypothetical protein